MIDLTASELAVIEAQERAYWKAVKDAERKSRQPHGRR